MLLKWISPISSYSSSMWLLRIHIVAHVTLWTALFWSKLLYGKYGGERNEDNDTRREPPLSQGRRTVLGPGDLVSTTRRRRGAAADGKA